MHPWEDNGSGRLYLFTEAEFNKLPDGIVLESIMGDKVIKGKDYIDLDQRFGYLAYGVRDPWNHPEKHLFLIFVLSQ
jgi:hypothetical protein